MHETINDYIGWRGDLSIQERGLTTADNLVLCFLSYVNLKSVWNGTPLTVRQAVHHLQKTSGIHLNILAGTEKSEEIVIRAAESERFGTLLIRDYVDILIPQEHIQFSATLFQLSENEFFTAYRGTDDTTAGWKEDFMITFKKTEAQQEALDFLRRHIKTASPDTTFIVAGHSKGGNLAMYASVFLSEEERSRIRHIFVNDGPGFCGDVLDTSLLKQIDSITTNIIPEYCVIGKLFDPGFHDVHIVKSTASGMLQHACETWELDHGALMEAEANDPQSIWINNIMDTWVENVSMDARKQFIDQMFDAVEEENSSFTELLKKGPIAFENILIRVIGTDKIVKHTLLEIPKSAVKETVDTKWYNRIHTLFNNKKELFTNIGFIMIGIILIIIPNHFMSLLSGLIFGIFVVAEFAITAYRLYKGKFRAEKERTRLIVCSILLALTLILIVKDNALFLLGSAVFGSALMLFALNGITTAQAAPPRTVSRWFHSIEASILLVLGLFILIAPQDTMKWYCSSVGCLLLIDGILRFILHINSDHKKTGVI